VESRGRGRTKKTTWSAAFWCVRKERYTFEKERRVQTPFCGEEKLKKRKRRESRERKRGERWVG